MIYVKKKTLKLLQTPFNLGFLAEKHDCSNQKK